MTTRITNVETARNWLKDNEPHTEITEDNCVPVSNACWKCGGSGYGYWRQDGGVCYACRGADTRGVSMVPVVKYAQARKAKKRAAETRARKAEEAAAARKERMLEGQRNWCEANGFGRITFEEKKQLEAAEREAGKATKKHVGTVGKRQEFTLTFKGAHFFDGFYGTVGIYCFEDADGNDLVWKTTSCADVNNLDHKGLTFVVKATVKDHGEYRDAPQTVINRVKIEKQVTFKLGVTQV